MEDRLKESHENLWLKDTQTVQKIEDGKSSPFVGLLDEILCEIVWEKLNVGIRFEAMPEDFFLVDFYDVLGIELLIDISLILAFSLNQNGRI